MPTVAEQLKDLAALRREGVLTEEEFEEQKRILLAQSRSQIPSPSPDAAAHMAQANPELAGHQKPLDERAMHAPHERHEGAIGGEPTRSPTSQAPDPSPEEEDSLDEWSERKSQIWLRACAIGAASHIALVVLYVCVMYAFGLCLGTHCDGLIEQCFVW